ncbi:GSCOCG00006158001-RA-CDS, partial [Cotesia congregata]
IVPANALVSYADDTAVLCSGSSWQVVRECLTEWLKNLDKWLKDNKLTLNVDKSTYITFGSYIDSVPTNFHLFIKDRKLKRVESCKYLGVVYDCHMKWNKHVT